MRGGTGGGGGGARAGQGELGRVKAKMNWMQQAAVLLRRVCAYHCCLLGVVLPCELRSSLDSMVQSHIGLLVVLYMLVMHGQDSDC